MDIGTKYNKKFLKSDYNKRLKNIKQELKNTTVN